MFLIFYFRIRGGEKGVIHNFFLFFKKKKVRALLKKKLTVKGFRSIPLLSNFRILKFKRVGQLYNLRNKAKKRFKKGILGWNSLSEKKNQSQQKKKHF